MKGGYQGVRGLVMRWRSRGKERKNLKCEEGGRINSDGKFLSRLLRPNLECVHSIENNQLLWMAGNFGCIWKLALTSRSKANLIECQIFRGLQMSSNMIKEGPHLKICMWIVTCN